MYQRTTLGQAKSELSFVCNELLYELSDLPFEMKI